MRKQLLACMMSGLLLATMTACGGAPKNDAPDDNATYSAEESSGESYETEDDLNNQEIISSDDSTESSEQEAVEVPELTYRMAPLYVRTEPTEYGYTYCSYAIEVDQVGFTFRTLYLKIIDKSTGEECDWANDYDWLGYPGKVCVEETPHYGVMFSDGWFDYWETDRSTLILTIEHQGDVLAPEDIQVVTGMEFNGQDIGEYTFEVNAELEDIGYNQCKVVHGFNLLKLKGELFVPDLSSVAVGGGTYDYDNNTWADGFTYTFVHMTDGDFNPEDYEGCFYPVRWDDAKKDFVPYEVPDGFGLRVEVKREGEYMYVFIGLEADMDSEIPYELYENIVPAYDDGETQMVFSWT